MLRNKAVASKGKKSEQNPHFLWRLTDFTVYFITNFHFFNILGLFSRQSQKWIWHLSALYLSKCPIIRIMIGQVYERRKTTKRMVMGCTQLHIYKNKNNIWGETKFNFSLSNLHAHPWYLWLMMTNSWTAPMWGARLNVWLTSIIYGF